jgi:beta-N-acetylhexosaminidase
MLTASPLPSTPFTPATPSERLAAMTLEQKIGQTIMIGFDGVSVDDGLRRMIRDDHLGGVILFARNIQSPQQVAALTNELQTLALESGHPGLFIAIDQEGSLVARLTEDKGFTEFPAGMALSATGDPENAYRVAVAMAHEMRAVGINVDFAPVLDVNNNPLNPVIGLRAFGDTPAIVSEYGLAFLRGLQENGVLAFGKHFPGHGDTSVDSHLALPLVLHDRARLDAIELAPFRDAIAAGVAGIMTAHVTFPAIDPTGQPATLSRPTLTGLLRTELGFDGLIVTDSLEMGALATEGFPPPVGASLSLAAGADILLFNRDHAMHQAVFDYLRAALQEGEISLEQLDAAVLRILQAKARFDILNPIPSLPSPVPQTAEHLTLSRDLTRASLTLLRDPQQLIPLLVTASPLVVEPEPLRGLTSFLGTTILEVSAQPTSAQIADVLHAARDGRLVIFPVYNLDANPKQLELITQLNAAGSPVLALIIRNPFDAARLPDEITVLITYGFNPPVREVLTALLNGQFQPGGILPVTLP